MAPPTSAEEKALKDKRELERKLDLCITDAVVKTGSSMVIGAMASLLFLGRRRWPIIAGIGVGIGLAYANCEFALQEPKADKEC